MIIKKSFIGILFLSIYTVSCGGTNDDLPSPEPEKPVTPVTPDEPEIPIHRAGAPYNTYKGLVMAGYQGWFGTPEDGCPHGNWYHYQGNGDFKPGYKGTDDKPYNSIDFWPDMTGYTQTYETAFELPNNKGKARVYSACDESSVKLHFKWMQDYGIDGVFMQRFVGEIKPSNPNGVAHFNKVLDNAVAGSTQYQRAIAVMYDASGLSNLANGVQILLDDAQAIMTKYALKDRQKVPFYLFHNDKPLIVVWGIGFSDANHCTVAEAQALVTGLKTMGYSVMLGVTTYWRNGGGDTVTGIDLNTLHTIITQADVIMPWFVGRYSTKEQYTNNFASLVSGDLFWCKSNQVDYAPLCFPGASDVQMHPANAIIDREHGQFFWTQLHNSVKSGAKMLYIAMFDEIDEGTAIYKCLRKNEVPASGARFEFNGIENDLSSDYYLWMTGQAGKMLRGEIPLSKDIPARQN